MSARKSSTSFLVSRPLAGAGALLVLAGVLGCGEGDKALRDATTAGGRAGAAGAAGATGSSGGSGPAVIGGRGGSAGTAGGAPVGKRVREVFDRNPFGDTNPENTLWDGDFEWSGGFVSQYPWISVSSFGGGFEAPDVKVSGQCWSGLKCGTLTGTRSAAGIAASPRTMQTRVRAYAKPSAGEACEVVLVQYDACFDSGVPRDIEARTAMPAASARGYCVYEADVPTLDATPCVFLSYEGTGDEVFIDAVFVGAPPEGQKPLSLSLRRPVSQDLQRTRQARLERDKAALRAFRDRPPPVVPPPVLTLPSQKARKLVY